MKKTKSLFVLALSLVFFAACKKESASTVVSKDINTASKVSIDRFSATAGHLMVRTATNGLPAANAPVNFDVQPFITMGYDRTGAIVNYYNFDVQSSAADDIYVFFKSGSTTPVTGQNNVIPTIPGDAAYTDFWRVNMVTVPDNYVANSLTSEEAILASGYIITKTTTIVNCPVVPFGSTAAKSFTPGTASVLTLGWYKDQAVAYFTFGEAALTAELSGTVPLSPIFVMFNVDPSDTDPNSGPASGFKTEPGTAQTHNVLSTIPGDAGYSPLWDVQVISNADFNTISNVTDAFGATSSPAGATVNCPLLK